MKILAVIMGADEAETAQLAALLAAPELEPLRCALLELPPAFFGTLHAQPFLSVQVVALDLAFIRDTDVNCAVGVSHTGECKDFGAAVKVFCSCEAETRRRIIRAASAQSALAWSCER